MGRSYWGSRLAVDCGRLADRAVYRTLSYTTLALGEIPTRCIQYDTGFRAIHRSNRLVTLTPLSSQRRRVCEMLTLTCLIALSSGTLKQSSPVDCLREYTERVHNSVTTGHIRIRDFYARLC